MKSNKLTAEEEQKAAELTDKLSAICAGNSLKCIRLAWQKLDDYILLYSVVSHREASSSFSDQNDIVPNPPSE